jgi:hypothetical protein
MKTDKESIIKESIHLFKVHGYYGTGAQLQFLNNARITGSRKGRVFCGFFFSQKA